MRTASLLILGLALGILGVGVFETYAQPLYGHYPGSYYFPDCSSASPHDHDVGYLYESAIVSGFPEGTYGPGMAVTRQQMASYIIRSQAIAYSLTFMSVDWNFFGGYYTGYQAYQDGRITLEEYQAATRVMEWATAAVRAQFDGMRDTDLETIFDIYF